MLQNILIYMTQNISHLYLLCFPQTRNPVLAKRTTLRLAKLKMANDKTLYVQTLL